MRRTSLVFVGALLLAAAACNSSSDSNEPEIEPEIRSQEDVQRFFEAIMPELVAAFTELANQQFAASSVSSKQGDSGSSVPCPEGGSLNVNPATGAASLVSCGVRGAVINATLALFVEPTGPSSYQASFNGILMVTGSFVGTVDVVQAFVQWTDPATVDNTYWEVTVLVGGQTATVSSADSGGNGGGNGADNACEWDRGGREGEVRVHVSNAFDLPGIFVELSAGGVTCAIEDENRELQLPIFGNTFPEDRDTVLAGDTFGGLGQALMPLAVGDTLNVKAWSAGQMAERDCVVSAEAFQNLPPNATAGQAFLDVLGVTDPTAFPTIDCGAFGGFELPGQTTEIRTGGTCNPEDMFSDCSAECLTICGQDTAQFWECRSDSVCECTCVNYGF